MKHKGGAGKKVIPQFQEPKGRPYVGKKQQELLGQRYNEVKPKSSKSSSKPKSGKYEPYQTPYVQKPIKKGQEPLVDLQVYGPPEKRPNLPDPMLYMPYATNTPYQVPQMLPQMYQNLPYTQGSLGLNNIPFVKKYNINIDGPYGDHVRVNSIFEDMLPKEYFSGTLDTLNERLDLHTLLRKTLIKKTDGEEVDFDKDSDNSLLKHIKFININPHSSNAHTSNPYKGLPDGLLIYSTCYPIRYASQGNYVKCSKDSVGIIVKIYNMTMDEYKIRNDQDLVINDFDLWREIRYYEFIRENIIKQHVCPNFALLYGYYIINNSKFDFDKIDQIKDNNNLRKIGPSSRMNLSGGNSNALVALTEAPTHNILQWGSHIYVTNGGVNKMINHGYHKNIIWRSVLFQIIAALYTMQLYGIALNGFNVFENIFIKDTTATRNINKHWKYVIDGIEYYVPNYGYIVMIDSNYRDISSGYSVGNRRSKPRKVYAKFFNDNGVSDNEIDRMCFDNFAKTFDPNIFKNDKSNYGFVEPPEDILELLGDIQNEIKNGRLRYIGDYISKYFRFYLHNRVGKYLKDNEVKYVRKDDTTPLKDGQMVVHETGYNTYKFVILLNTYDGKARILTKDDNAIYEPDVYSEASKHKMIIEKEVRVDSLYNFAKSSKIKQKFNKDGTNLSDSGLLETYYIN